MPVNLERRVQVLERQVAQLQKRHVSANGREWVDDLYGKFANDQLFAQAMKLGRKYRKSSRPSGRKNARAR